MYMEAGVAPRRCIGSDARLRPVGFFATGVWLFALKFLIDRLVATQLFGRSWPVLNYLIPLESVRVLSGTRADRWFYSTMLAVALPFVVLGMLVTLARLRDARLPRWLALLFFVPAVNLLFFAALSVVPSNIVARVRRRGPDESSSEELPFARPVDHAELTYGRDEPTPAQRALARVWPRGAASSAALAVLIPVPFVLVITYVAVNFFHGYGLGLFVGMPFALGLVSSLLHGLRIRRSGAQCAGVACLSLAASGTAMIALAIEGLGCLIMLAPLAIPVALMGAAMGFSLQVHPASPGRIERPIWSMIVVLPLLIGGEWMVKPAPLIFAVTTVIDVDAPANVVWIHVVSFSDISRPGDWIFRLGVAYPVRARITGAGVGAIRHCEFSTGAFVEPIRIWDEPRLLHFTVTENPAPMKEFSPFDIHPPHLDNFLVAHAGEFKLIDLGNGRTRIEGTTWYEHRMWPQTYWRWWSDYIIHRIHRRVLEHVKMLSEQSKIPPP